MATTVRYYALAANSIHYTNNTDWNNIIAGTYDSDVDPGAGTTAVDTSGVLKMSLGTGPFEQTFQHGFRWTEYSRIGMLFNTNSLPDTLSITSVKLSIKVKSWSQSTGAGWDPNPEFALYGFENANNSALAVSDYIHLETTQLSDGKDSSDWKNVFDERLEFTLTDTTWIQPASPGISAVGIRATQEFTGAHGWVDNQTHHVNFYGAGVQADAPYIEIVYDDATAHTILFTEDLTALDTTAPADVATPAGAFTDALKSNLVSYYKMDNDWKDAHGDNDGTATTATFSSTYKLGTHSGYFDGGGYVTLANETSFDFSEDFSYSFWFKLNGSAVWSQILNKRDASDYTAPWQIGYEKRAGQQEGLKSFMGSGSASVQTGGTSSNVSSPTSWNHCVFTIEGTTTKLYINGALDATVTFTGTRQANNRPVRIGGSYTYGSANYPMDGVMDGVGFWSRAISATEVSELYNGGSGLPYALAVSGGGGGGGAEVPIHSDDLVFHVNANNTDSYGGSGTVWNDLGFLLGIRNKRCIFSSFNWGGGLFTLLS